MNTTDKAFGKFPWNYTESFIFLVFLLFCGAALQYIVHSGVTFPEAPFNFLAGGLYLLLLLILYPIFKKHPVVIWLSGKAASLSAMTGILLLLLFMVLIPQNQSKAGIFSMMGATRVVSSWSFFFTLFYLLTGLGMATLRRMWPFKGNNIGFFLNHSGLWISIMVIFLGFGDLKRLSVNLLKNSSENNIGISSQGLMEQLPFNLSLIDFKLDEYAPELALFSEQDSLRYRPLKILSKMPEENSIVTTGSWIVRISEYLPGAIPVDSVNYMLSNVAGSCPAALVEAVKRQSGDTVSGWIASGSYYQPAVLLTLEGSGSIGLTLPEPENFSSEIRISGDSLKTDTFNISVNRSFDIKNWRIYQMSYDKNKGKWSTLSVLEAVHDPWLPLLKLGIILFLAGFIYMLLYNIITKKEA